MPDAVAAPPVDAPLTTTNLTELGKAWASQPPSGDTPTGDGVARETAPAPVGDTEPEGAPEGQDAVPEGGEAPPEAKAKAPEGAKLIRVEHNGQVYDLPEDLPVPFKVNGELQTKALKDALRANSAEGAIQQMRETVKLTERGARASVAAAEAEATALRAVIQRIRENPTLADRIVNDPDFAAEWDKGVAKDVGDAKTQAASEVTHQSEVATIQDTVLGWAEEMAVQYPDLDPNEVVRSYGDYLKSDAAQRDRGALTPDRLKSFFESANGKVRKVTGPLEARLTALEARNKELEAALKANTKTAKVVERAAAPPITGGGAGVAPGTGAVSGLDKAGKPRELRDASADWARQR